MDAVYTPFHELAHPCSAVFPLLPDYGSKPSPDPMLQRSQPVERFGYPIIAPPALHIHVEFIDHLLDTATAPTGRDFAYPLSEPLDRLPVDADLRILA